MMVYWLTNVENGSVLLFCWVSIPRFCPWTNQSWVLSFNFICWNKNRTIWVWLEVVTNEYQKLFCIQPRPPRQWRIRRIFQTPAASPVNFWRGRSYGVGSGDLLAAAPTWSGLECSLKVGLGVWDTRIVFVSIWRGTMVLEGVKWTFTRILIEFFLRVSLLYKLSLPKFF